MLRGKTTKKITTLIMTILMLAGAAVPAGAFAETSGDEGYVYKYIGTDNNNKGNNISYYDTEAKKRTTSSTVMFKLKSGSNVDLAYCCDLDTYAISNTYYKRTNLENAGYFKADVARSIRNVVVNGYDPANNDSTKELQAAVNDWASNTDKREQVTNLSKSDAITATQLAVWSLANPEMAPSSTSNTVSLVKDYLLSLPERDVAPNETVAESLDVTANIEKEKGTDKVTLSGEFSFYSKPETDAVKTKVTPEGDSITFGISIGTTTLFLDNLENMMEEGTVVLDPETLEYTYEIKGVDYDSQSTEVNVEIAVSGEQELPRGAYFYKTPNRGDSQNFVGIADWNKVLDLYASASAEVVEPETPEEPEAPVIPEVPSEPEEPVNPETPAEPEEPTVPGELVGSEPPTIPEEPSIPKEPATPEAPSTPEEPMTTEEPAAPESPTEPDSPVVPDEPVEPEEPTVPEAPTEPEGPIEPDMPHSPKTGDDASMLLWGMMAATSLAIMGMMMALKRKEA